MPLQFSQDINISRVAQGIDINAVDGLFAGTGRDVNILDHNSQNELKLRFVSGWLPTRTGCH